MWLHLFLVPFACFLTFLAFLLKPSLKRKTGFWKARGIPEIDATFVASELDVLLGRKDITERDDYLYQVMDAEGLSFCGVAENPIPIILLKDVDLIKKVLIKDFDHFVDRRLFFGAAREDSVLRKMLGNLQGDEWKGVRCSVSPTFTTGKIKRMMGVINTVCHSWVQQLSVQANLQNEPFTVNVFNCVRKYTSNVIASAIFGLHPAKGEDSNELFSEMANRLIDMNTFQIIKFTLSLRFPKVFQFFNIDILDMEALRYFETLLKSKLHERLDESEDSPKRNDFLQLLVEARKSESNKTAEAIDMNLNNREFLTDRVLSGQCLSFFFAGFRTTSHFISFALYVLAVYPEVQEKLRKEVKPIMTDETVDYERLSRLVYMDMVLCEILRKFPATLRLERACVEDYSDPDSGLNVPKGAIVGVPLNAIHNDRKYYEKPDEFYPEHFLPEKKAGRSPYAFMPFGLGPRNCIGMRFALVESKALLAHVVYNFNVKPTSSTVLPVCGRRANFQISPPPHLEVRLERIN